MASSNYLSIEEQKQLHKDQMSVLQKEIDDLEHRISLKRATWQVQQTTLKQHQADLQKFQRELNTLVNSEVSASTIKRKGILSTRIAECNYSIDYLRNVSLNNIEKAIVFWKTKIVDLKEKQAAIKNNLSQLEEHENAIRAELVIHSDSLEDPNDDLEKLLFEQMQQVPSESAVAAEIAALSTGIGDQSQANHISQDSQNSFHTAVPVLTFINQDANGQYYMSTKNTPNFAISQLPFYTPKPQQLGGIFMRSSMSNETSVTTLIKSDSEEDQRCNLPNARNL